MVRVVDVGQEVLDNVGLVGFERFKYRLFIRQLITLWKRGRVTFRVRSPPKRVLDELENEGIAYKVYRDEEKGRVTLWIKVKDEETLMRVYACVHSCSIVKLREIVKMLKRYEEIHVV